MGGGSTRRTLWVLENVAYLANTKRIIAASAVCTAAGAMGFWLGRRQEPAGRENVFPFWERVVVIGKNETSEPINLVIGRERPGTYNQVTPNGVVNMSTAANWSGPNDTQPIRVTVMVNGKILASRVVKLCGSQAAATEPAIEALWDGREISLRATTPPAKSSSVRS